MFWWTRRDSDPLPLFAKQRCYRYTTSPFWRRRKDSNPNRMTCKAIVLPLELRALWCSLGGKGGVEPRLSRVTTDPAYRGTFPTERMRWDLNPHIAGFPEPKGFGFKGLPPVPDSATHPNTRERI